MRVLREIDPTPEQLTIIQDYQPGFVVTRGAAGSGKTTTAVLRLRHVTNMWRRQRERDESDQPVRVLVLTYNRTLRGYIEELVAEQIDASRFELTLETFGKWSWNLLGRPPVVDDWTREKTISQLARNLRLPPDFVADEVDYVLGRFPHDRLTDYADPAATAYERRGRGTIPRMERPLRQRLLDEVLLPYLAWLEQTRQLDWNQVAIRAAQQRPAIPYDIVVVDEAQDFSANQIRAIVAHLAQQHSTTFVLDAVQRIYPRGFDWVEAGVTPIARSIRLRRNFRNTRQIAAFAFPLVKDLPLEDDGTLPEFKESQRSNGTLPTVVRGRFAGQMAWVIDRIANLPVDESVALLAPRGGRWLDYARNALNASGHRFVEITRRTDWPQGSEEIAISTLHSSKGLEFDHVVILGLSAEGMPHGPEDNDSQLANHRRLVAMGIGRARLTVALTYKPGEESSVVHLLDPSTYEGIDV